MAMRVNITDLANQICVDLRASGGYAPDCMNDLCERAKTIYREALADSFALTAAYDTQGDCE